MKYLGTLLFAGALLNALLANPAPALVAWDGELGVAAVYVTAHSTKGA